MDTVAAESPKEEKRKEGPDGTSATNTNARKMGITQRRGRTLLTRGAEEETEGQAEARKRTDTEGCNELKRMTINRVAGEGKREEPVTPENITASQRTCSVACSAAYSAAFLAARSALCSAAGSAACSALCSAACLVVC